MMFKIYDYLWLLQVLIIDTFPQRLLMQIPLENPSGYCFSIGKSFSSSSWSGFLLKSAILKDSEYVTFEAFVSPYHFFRHCLTASFGLFSHIFMN